MKENDNTNKPKEIKAEISIEVTGENKPTKYALKRAKWAARARWSLLAVIASLIYTIIVGIEVSSFVFFGISVFSLFFSWAKSIDTAPEEFSNIDASTLPTDTIHFDNDK